MSVEVYDPSTINKLLKLKDKADKLTGISQLFYRTNYCVENCGGCCMKFSLVYWGDRWEKFKALHPQEVKYYTKKVVLGKEVWEDSQEDNPDYFCKHMNKHNGRCKLHFTQKPIHCEMEPISFSDGLLVKRPFKEAHLMKTLEGQGAICYMSEITGIVEEKEIALLEELNTLFESKPLERIIDELRNL